METSIQPTRWEILQILKKRSRATVEELATTLGLTLMGVRLHLVVLERDGLVSRQNTRERIGRPALVYSLTEDAEEVFPKAYDMLTCTIFEELGREGDQETLSRVCRSAARNLAASLSSRVNVNSTAAKVESVVGLLNDRQYFASGDVQDAGYQIHLYNCPFYRVARQYRQICEFDRQFLAQLLNANVSLTGSLVARQGCCTFTLPGTETA